MKQILVVDDSPTIRRMVRASLARFFPTAEFLEAASGLQAIERLALGSIGLILLDLNMPDMHGLEVLEFVRSHEKYRHVPVAILTTRSDDDSRSAAMKAGASVYLTKPFSPNVLGHEVRKLFAGDDGLTVSAG